LYKYFVHLSSLTQSRSTIFFDTLLSNQATIHTYTHETNFHYTRLYIRHHNLPQYPSLTSTPKGITITKLPPLHERNLLTLPKPTTHHLLKPATMFTITTAPASSPQKRTSEQASFTACPLPPKHRKLNTTLALAVSHRKNSKPGEKTAPFALPPPLTAQQSIDLDRLKRTWYIEFDSPLTTPEYYSDHYSRRRANVWRVLSGKRYDDCAAQVAVWSVEETMLGLMCMVKLNGHWFHFQGRMHSKGCGGVCL